MDSLHEYALLITNDLIQRIIVLHEMAIVLYFLINYKPRVYGINKHTKADLETNVTHLCTHSRITLLPFLFVYLAHLFRL